MPEYNSKPSTVRGHARESHWSVAGLCIVWAALPWIDWWRPIGSGVLIALTGAAAGCVLLVRLARTSLQAYTRRRYRHAAMGILRTEHGMGKPRTHARGHNKHRHLHGGTPNA